MARLLPLAIVTVLFSIAGLVHSQEDVVAPVCDREPADRADVGFALLFDSSSSQTKHDTLVQQKAFFEKLIHYVGQETEFCRHNMEFRCYAFTEDVDTAEEDVEIFRSSNFSNGAEFLNAEEQHIKAFSDKVLTSNPDGLTDISAAINYARANIKFGLRSSATKILIIISDFVASKNSKSTIVAEQNANMEGWKMMPVLLKSPVAKNFAEKVFEVALGVRGTAGINLHKYHLTTQMIKGALKKVGF